MTLDYFDWVDFHKYCRAYSIKDHIQLKFTQKSHTMKQSPPNTNQAKFPLVSINDDEQSHQPQSVMAWLASKFTAGSIKGSIFELMVATIGSGVLVLPTAFLASGLAFSISQLVTWAVLGYISTMLLAKCGQLANKYSYSEIAEVTYGVWFQLLVRLVFFLNNWGGCVVYTILITNCIGTALGIFFPNLPSFLIDPNSYFWPPVYTTLIILPLSLFRDLSALRYTSLMSFIITCFLAIVIIYQSVNYSNIAENFKKIDNFILSGIAVTFPNTLYSYSCHPNVLDVFHELQRSSMRRMSKVLFRCMMIACIIYVIVGSFGYITFADKKILLSCKGNILLSFYQNYPTLIIICLILIGISITLAMPLSIKPSKDSLRDLLFGRYVSTSEERKSLLNETEYVKKEDSRAKHILLVIAVVYSQMLCGMFIQKMSDAITLLGASAYPMINYVFPIMFYLKLDSRPLASGKKLSLLFLMLFMMSLATYSTYAFFADRNTDACPA